MIKKISIQVILFLMIPMSSLSSLAPPSYQLNNFGENKKSKVNIAERQDTVQPPLKNPILLSVKDYHNLNPLQSNKPSLHLLFYFSKNIYRDIKQIYKNMLDKNKEKDQSPEETITTLGLFLFIVIIVITSPILLSLIIVAIPGMFFLKLTHFLVEKNESRETKKWVISIKICSLLSILLLAPIIIVLVFLLGIILIICFILTFLLDLLTFIPRKYFTKKEEKKEEIPQEFFLTLLIANKPLATQDEFTNFLYPNLQNLTIPQILKHSSSAQRLILNIDEFVTYHQNRPNTDNLDLVACAIKKLLFRNKENMNDAILDLMVTLKLLVENKANHLKDKDRCRMMILHNLLVTLYNAHQMNVFQDKEDIFNFQINIDEALNIPKDKIDPSIWMNKLRKSA